MGQANSRQEAFWDACGFGRTHLVKKFIEEGIDINWVSFTHDCCPIHVASQGKPDVVKLLIEAKCDINVQDSRGMTALHHAAMKGEEEIVSMLIDAGCELNTQNKDGWTALHNAAYWAHVGVVEKLISAGASVAMANKHQRLALHEVARSQSTEETQLGRIAQLLVAAGSDVDATSSDFGEADFTSLMFAAYHGHTEVVNALVDADCDINANGSINKWTALHWAADRGHDDIVRLLVESGADAGKKNMRGETAADRAKADGTREYLLNCINDQAGLAAERSSISSSQSFNAQTALDTALAIEKITAQTKSSASASAFVPSTMPPLAIATSEERKRNIRLGVKQRTSAGSASGPTSPGWSPGSAPHVELASDSLGADTNDPNIQLLRAFQDRLNRRIDEASRTLQGGLLRPEGAPDLPAAESSYSSSSGESSALEQTSSTTSAAAATSSREATLSSREATQGSESTGASSVDDAGEGEQGEPCGEGSDSNGVSVSESSLHGVSVDGVSATIEALSVSQNTPKAGEGDLCASAESAVVEEEEKSCVAQTKVVNGNVSADPGKVETNL
ncbi:uncharacterized protein LOC143276868 [Babylonia areolata]|uniref:uncharacterized protein LOC143276868 n=1 Tax=Babylonia areolata TaxID=304850 RepID=UPI003FCFDEC8